MFQDLRYLLRINEWLLNAFLEPMLTYNKDTIAGLDARQMDGETLRTETQKYNPFANRKGELHLD